MEGLCDTSLCLGFGSQIKYSNEPESCFNLSFPLVSESSSTLGLSDDTKKTSVESHSAMQPICQMGVKKEQDLGTEETEVKRVRRNDREEVGVRKKLRLTKEQAVILEDSYKVHNTLNQKQKQALVQQLNVSQRQLEVWFQNRRARTKLKKMEVDAERLQKLCETLKKENTILQKELDDLKAFEVAPLLRMRLPEATLTLTMCPSCEDGRVINPLSEDP